MPPSPARPLDDPPEVNIVLYGLRLVAGVFGLFILVYVVLYLAEGRASFLVAAAVAAAGAGLASYGAWRIDRDR